MIFPFSQPTKTVLQLREEAGKCDRRAAAADRDGDWADRNKWRDEALKLRRQARNLEFDQ